MLDHYFNTHSLKESICYCHADNCVGQNKNSYFAWWVLTGKHTQIYFIFYGVGHTRCLVDGHFGLIKKSYRRMDCDTLQHLVEATHRSTVNNIPQLFTWQWYVKEHANSAQKEILIFKKDVTAVKVSKAKLPNVISPAGLSRERQKYLYKKFDRMLRPNIKISLVHHCIYFKCIFLHFTFFACYGKIMFFE